MLTNTEEAEEGLFQGMLRALQALARNKGCVELFGTSQTRPGTYHPITVLSSLVSGYFNGTGSDYGEIKLVAGTSDASVKKDGFLGLGGRIIVSLPISGMRGGYDAAIAHAGHTLLHELGHVYDLLAGSGGSALASPDYIPVLGIDQTKKNDWLVDQRCFGGQLGYKEP